ncbi:glycosyltransferase family 2 protein [Nibricoccus sp. IMCC34717]|uniref:glycosyltransferase family 2 protein n=1 Tax=Nibricoccus sp. IMCC34717 TaxID=3034021 RepID=UPI00384CFE93
MLKYTIVIATRNRAEALALSIPLFLRQSCAADEIIIVDSSDDHAGVRRLVERICAGRIRSYKVLQSERGLTRQRNLGLHYVSNPVVFFPDDDSIWFPNTAEAQLQVYSEIGIDRVAGVCAVESVTPPDSFNSTATAYRMKSSDSLSARFQPLRRWIEGIAPEDPARALGKEFINSKRSIDFSATPDVYPVEWMTGFRMSFTTRAIAGDRFDENFRNYSLFEDIDASFKAWKYGLVLASRNSKVFHYKSPERRDTGVRLGFEQLINKAYIVSQHAGLDSPSRIGFRAFAMFKIIQYTLGGISDFNRQKLRGALGAYKQACRMALLPAESARSFYQSLSHIKDS